MRKGLYKYSEFERTPKRQDELTIRIKHNGAIKRNGKYFCSVHTEIELTSNGECSQCIETDHIVASENAERRAQKAYDDALENDT